ncbi:MAG: hypothetical protein ACW99Q_22180 [Candidatus Kariarchaeaceae archaeon]|jgi:hypothetical protein
MVIKISDLNKFKVRLPEKSRSTTFDDLLKIINRNKYWKEGKFYFVGFDEPSPDLKKLFRLGSSLRAFLFLINNKEIDRTKLRNIQEILFCEEAKSCNSLCSLKRLYEYGWYGSVGDLSKTFRENAKISPEKNTEVSDHHLRRLVSDNSDLFICIDEEKQKYRLSKEKILESFIENYSDELNYCPIFDKDKFVKEISNFSETVQLFDYQRSLTFEIKTDKIAEPEEEYIEKVSLTEEQINILSKSISLEIEIVLRKLFDEAGFLKKK